MRILRKVLFCSLLASAISTTFADNVSFDFTVGDLKTAGGSAFLGTGALIQIIASPDITFTSPSASDFLGGGNDILLWSGGFNNVSGFPGAMQIPTFTVDATSVSNYYLAIRWFPTLTTSATAPGANTSYGQYAYGSDSASTSTTISGNPWQPWQITSSSGSLAPNFLTLSAGGPSDNSLGYASNTITAVPEPSSYAALVALFSLGLLIKHWGRKDSHA